MIPPLFDPNDSPHLDVVFRWCHVQQPLRAGSRYKPIPEPKITIAARNQASPATAVLITRNLPIKPAVKGIPARETASLQSIQQSILDGARNTDGISQTTRFIRIVIRTRHQRNHTERTNRG